MASETPTANPVAEAVSTPAPSASAPAPSDSAPAPDAPKSPSNERSNGPTPRSDRGPRTGRHKKRKADHEWKAANKRSRNDEPAGGWPERKPRDNPFTAEEIAAEDRKPKKKVAVLIGYSGTGYKGMQINDQEKTIEGDLFKAFVAAGAIAKANADDPKKSSLMRCARTDKGVHAAGNVISLKLIQEPNLVERINEHLAPQIRVWGIQRTNNQFNCYKSCDSRWYEYLLPSYCLLPPHPESYLGKKIREQAVANNAVEEVEARLADVAGFWEAVDEQEVKPLLAGLDPEVRAQVLVRMHASESLAGGLVDGSEVNEKAAKQERAAAKEAAKEAASTGEEPAGPREPTAVDFALRDIKHVYIAAKRRYRVTPTRLSQLQNALDKYVGTNNFYNYTVRTEFKDPSAKRHIKSFKANTTPIVINNTEWISLKVHGQSFMMHQIRKMVGLATLVTRCGSPLNTIDLTYQENKMAIPKAPSLGLLLECPVFETYNNKAGSQLGLETLSFDRHMDKILPFKHEFIYSRIYEVEEKDNSFHEFFQQVDNFKSPYFLWLTAGGLEAAKAGTSKSTDTTDAELTKQLEGDESDEEKGDS